MLTVQGQGIHYQGRGHMLHAESQGQGHGIVMDLLSANIPGCYCNIEEYLLDGIRSKGLVSCIAVNLYVVAKNSDNLM